jgi:hypothetical protein
MNIEDALDSKSLNFIFGAASDSPAQVAKLPISISFRAGGAANDRQRPPLRIRAALNH